MSSFFSLETYDYQKWTPNFDFDKEVLNVIPIWVKLPNMPLNCYSENSHSIIASLLEVPLYADECTAKVLRVSFSRILEKWM